MYAVQFNRYAKIPNSRLYHLLHFRQLNGYTHIARYKLIGVCKREKCGIYRLDARSIQHMPYVEIIENDNVLERR